MKNKFLAVISPLIVLAFYSTTYTNTNACNHISPIHKKTLPLVTTKHALPSMIIPTFIRTINPKYFGHKVILKHRGFSTKFSNFAKSASMEETLKPSNVEVTLTSDDNTKPVSQQLWKQCQKQAYQSLHHPWFVSMALGTLNRESFAQYIAQDAFFLESFAKGYAFALGKCGDREGITAFHGLIGAVLEELQLHSGLAEKWGVDLESLREPKQATTEYVDFLISTSQAPESSSADILASMAPCMRLYAFLGQTIKKSFKIEPDHPYAEWIETYSSSEFEEAAKTVEDLLDKYASDSNMKTMSSLYQRAMELEYNFFDAQDVSKVETVKPLDRIAGVVVDFDETCTDADTTPVLRDLVKAHRPVEEHPEIDRLWKELTDLYLDDYYKVLGKVQDQVKQEGPFDALDENYLNKLTALLDQLCKVGTDSVERVVESKVLRGVPKDSIQPLLTNQLRTQWKLREGCLEALHHFVNSGVGTKIISINWSSILISAILQAKSSGGDLDIEIFSNDLCFDDSMVTNGVLLRSIDGASEKRDKFMDVSKDILSEKSFIQGADSIIYFGDSLTDLLAMEASGVPVLIGSSNSFRTFCDSAGIEIKPLFSAYEIFQNSTLQGSRNPSFTVYHAESWNEIQTMFFGSLSVVN